MLLINDGSGNFVVGASFPSSTTLAVAFADVDGDMDLDLFVGNQGATCADSCPEVRADSLLINDGSGHFSNSKTFVQELDAHTSAVAFGDVNSDGFVDLILGNDGNQANQLLINDGTGSFTSSATFPGSDAITKALVAADMDGDGDLDVIIGNSGANELLMYTFCPAGGAQLHAASACFACPIFMGRHNPSMCLECLPDVESAGIYITGETCVIPCVLEQRPLGVDACQPCSEVPGTYYDPSLERTNNPATWMEPRCADCFPGKYSDAEGFVCLPCIPGSFTGSTASSSCEACPAGTYTTDVSSTACETCPPGAFCPTGSVNTQQCPGESKT